MEKWKDYSQMLISDWLIKSLGGGYWKADAIICCWAVRLLFCDICSGGLFASNLLCWIMPLITGSTEGLGAGCCWLFSC